MTDVLSLSCPWKRFGFAMALTLGVVAGSPAGPAGEAQAANGRACEGPMEGCQWPTWGWRVLLVDPADRTGPNTWREGARARALSTAFEMQADCDRLAAKAMEVEPDKDAICAWTPLSKPVKPHS